MAKKRNLKGYKREGKRFIPPMKQLAMVREQSYVNDMLPELIWLGLIHDRRGYRFGATVLEKIVEVTKTWPKNDKPRNYAVQAAYEALAPEQKTELLEALTNDMDSPCPERHRCARLKTVSINQRNRRSRP
jgi:hypothetical protein